MTNSKIWLFPSPVPRWVPLMFYCDSGVTFLVLARRKKSGMVQFATRRVTRLGTLSHQYPSLDMNEQFAKVLGS